LFTAGGRVLERRAPGRGRLPARAGAGTDVYRKIEHGIDRIVRLADSVLVYGWQRMTMETVADFPTT
jgi:hypothetical protein